MSSHYDPDLTPYMQFNGEDPSTPDPTIAEPQLARGLILLPISAMNIGCLIYDRTLN